MTKPKEDDASEAHGPALLSSTALSKLFVLPGRNKEPNAALNGVSLAIDRGAAVAIVGESGSGKSTLLRLLAGIEKPTQGHVAFEGHDIAKASSRIRKEYRRRVQMIFQDPFASLNPVHRIQYQLARPLLLSGAANGGNELTSRVDGLLESVGLPGTPEFRRRFPHELSGGQRQRVAIARALATEPAVLLADEPTSMLDVSIRIGILNLFEKLRVERDIALLYVTHDIASARYAAAELHVMYAGYVVEAGPSDELLAAPAHPYTRRLLSAVPGSRLKDEPAPSKADATMATERRGCPFRAKCGRRVSICETTMPEVTAPSPSRRLRCHSPL